MLHGINGECANFLYVRRGQIGLRSSVAVKSQRPIASASLATATPHELETGIHITPAPIQTRLLADEHKPPFTFTEYNLCRVAPEWTRPVCKAFSSTAEPEACIIILR